MPFVQISSKPKAYFKRYQVQFRRKREGKTDYVARRGLIHQPKNKYNAPKYRLVVRLTDHYIICQIAAAQLNGDRIVACAHSSELKRYGVSNGYKNYPAAYCTGLLIGRRLLNKWKMDGIFKPNNKLGDEFHVEEKDDKTPVKCVLDVGIRPTTTGSRLFGAMKGAVDAGLSIPYKPIRFPGYKENKYNPKKHEERIKGQHIATYMKKLEGEGAEVYKRQFGKYIEKKVTSETLTKMYEAAHKAIIADPKAAPKKEFKPDKKCKKYAHFNKMSNKAFKARVERRLQKIQSTNENA